MGCSLCPGCHSAPARAAQAVTGRAQMGLSAWLCSVLSLAAAPAIPKPLEVAEGHSSASVQSPRAWQRCPARARHKAGLSLRTEQPGNCCQEDSQVFVLTGACVSHTWKQPSPGAPGQQTPALQAPGRMRNEAQSKSGQGNQEKIIREDLEGNWK